MPTDYEQKLHEQVTGQRKRQWSRIVTAKGGGEAREFTVAPLRTPGCAGAFLTYRRWRGIYEAKGPSLIVDEFASLTKTEARRLAYALLLWSEESEEESDDPVVLPLR